MDFIDSGIQDYSNKFTTKTNKNLENLERETYLKTIQPNKSCINVLLLIFLPSRGISINCNSSSGTGSLTSK